MIYKAKMNRLVSVQREESIEAPEELVKLVKSNDKHWGKNGINWFGCDRGKGKEIDRLQAYICAVHQSVIYRNGMDYYPIKLDTKGMFEVRHCEAVFLPASDYFDQHELHSPVAV